MLDEGNQSSTLGFLPTENEERGGVTMKASELIAVQQFFASLKCKSTVPRWSGLGKRALCFMYTAMGEVDGIVKSICKKEHRIYDAL